MDVMCAAEIWRPYWGRCCRQNCHFMFRVMRHVLMWNVFRYVTLDWLEWLNRMMMCRWRGR